MLRGYLCGRKETFYLNCIVLYKQDYCLTLLTFAPHYLPNQVRCVIIPIGYQIWHYFFPHLPHGLPFTNPYQYIMFC